MIDYITLVSYHDEEDLDRIELIVVWKTKQINLKNSLAVDRGRSKSIRQSMPFSR